jgi:hypothetical protein
LSTQKKAPSPSRSRLRKSGGGLQAAGGGRQAAGRQAAGGGLLPNRDRKGAGAFFRSTDEHRRITPSSATTWPIVRQFKDFLRSLLPIWKLSVILVEVVFQRSVGKKVGMALAIPLVTLLG